MINRLVKRDELKSLHKCICSSSTKTGKVAVRVRLKKGINHSNILDKYKFLCNYGIRCEGIASRVFADIVKEQIVGGSKLKYLTLPKQIEKDLKYTWKGDVRIGAKRWWDFCPYKYSVKEIAFIVFRLVMTVVVGKLAWVYYMSQAGQVPSSLGSIPSGAV